MVTAKTISELDDHCRKFIARSPFVVIASSDAAGNCDVSPKGDPPGFVRVLDGKNLLIPERPGNHRADTFCNVIENPKVGLIFLVPGSRETLRVSGTARLVADEDVRRTMEEKGKVPDLVLAVHVEEAFFHCAKCVIRSGLWEPERWSGTEGLPSLARTMIDHGKLGMTEQELAEDIKDDEKERLY